MRVRGELIFVIVNCQQGIAAKADAAGCGVLGGQPVVTKLVITMLDGGVADPEGRILLELYIFCM